MARKLFRSWCLPFGLLLAVSSLLALPDAIASGTVTRTVADVERQSEDGFQMDIGTAASYEQAAQRALPAPAAVALPTARPAPTPRAAPAAVIQAARGFGVLQSSGRYGPNLKRAGLSLATLELSWDSYQPGPGRFDEGYAAQQRQKADALRSAGLGVVLDVGLQYAPSWLFARDPNAYYVNQYGDRYDSGPRGAQVGNGVFDPLVRQAQSDYIARVASDLGGSFVAIRVGGGWFGEAHYPPADYRGHSNSYWAYDANAVAGSPVRGWRPGQPSVEQAQAFWSYYTGKLSDYLQWQVSTYRSHFPSSSLEILYPGWGVRPGEAAVAVAGLLNGRTPSEANGEMQQGNDYAATLSALRDPGLIPYSTWLEAPDKGPTPQTVSPIRYLQELAAPRGLQIAGENSDGGRSEASMRLCIQRVRTIPGMLGMMWLAEPDLVQGGQRALGTYGQLIRS
jgi:hypothetical protein